jgi:hypothetical protein
VILKEEESICFDRNTREWKGVLGNFSMEHMEFGTEK